MLPTTIKVGGVDYTVEEVSNLIAKDDLWGKVDYFNSSIAVDDSLSPTRKEQVLIHELTHAIFLEAGYKEQDEDMINRIGIVLHQVLKDNPNLVNPLANVTQVKLEGFALSKADLERIKNAPLTELGI